MDILITELLPDHAAAIANLSGQLGHSVIVADIEKRLLEVWQHPEHGGFVAIYNETVIGWIHGFYTIRIQSEPFIEIGSLLIDKQFRRLGIGQLLVEKVMQWGAGKGVNKIRVRCRTDRSGAHNFYRMLGFQENKEQKVFDKLIS